MNKEEKEIIKKWNNYLFNVASNNNIFTKQEKEIDIILNLIKKQQEKYNKAMIFLTIFGILGVAVAFTLIFVFM